MNSSIHTDLHVFVKHGGREVGRTAATAAVAVRVHGPLERLTTPGLVFVVRVVSLVLLPQSLRLLDERLLLPVVQQPAEVNDRRDHSDCRTYNVWIEC